MLNILLVALGGILGSLLRYSIYMLSRTYNIPTFIPTIICNGIAGFLVGFLSYSLKNTNLQYLFITGFLGSLSTFSTFNIETIQMLNDKSFILAICNILANIFISFILCYLGIKMYEVMYIKL